MPLISVLSDIALYALLHVEIRKSIEKISYDPVYSWPPPLSTNVAEHQYTQNITLYTDGLSTLG